MAFIIAFYLDWAGLTIATARVILCGGEWYKVISGEEVKGCGFSDK